MIAATPHRMGMLFEIIEALGEDPRFTFTLQRVDAAQPHASPIASMEISHAESDGYGGMSRFLRREGVEFVAPAQREDTAPPSWRERVRAFVRVVRHRPASPLVLRARETAWKPGDRVTHRPTAGRLLSAEASARVFAAAKAAGASVSSFLLHGLTEAVAPEIAEPSATVTWGVPVNMRGPVRMVPDDANCSSLMPVDVPRGATPAAVHESLTRAFAANLHWGKWDQLNTAARLGRRILTKKVSAYYKTAGAARIGVFSNVGVWSGTTDADVGVVPYGVPVLPDPLFAGAITWNGKLALTLRAHPSLGVDDATVARWLEQWALRLEPVLSEAEAPSRRAQGERRGAA